MTRRRFVREAGLAGVAGAAGLAVWDAPVRAMAQGLSAQEPARTGIPGTAALPANLPTLREAAEQRGFLVGTAVATEPLRTDLAYAQLICQQANLIVAENAMKFGPLRPAPDRFFFDDADALFAFAASYGMHVRGHNFVWHRQLPSWFAGYASKVNAAELLTQHIATVGGRYAGRVHSWDVVNEAIELQDGLPGGLRNSPWYQLLGPAYLDLAFRTARAVDPKALLTYNEYGIESESPGDSAKRAAVLTLLRGLQARGVPVDAVGVQSHLVAGGAVRYGPGLAAFLDQVHSMGLKVLLTELDVNDRALAADRARRDEAVAAVYRDFLQQIVPHPAITALLTWGLTDRYTWLNAEAKRADGLPQRALPFDADLRPKQAYVAEVAAVLAARPRG